MYTTVRIYRNAGALGDALANREPEIRALIERVDGFRSYALVRTFDGAVTVTSCENRAGCDESTRVAGQWLTENLPDLAITPEVLEGACPIFFSATAAAV